MSEQLTGQTVELLQALIRNRCVNDGTAESGHEVRNADVLRQFLGSTGLDMQQYEPTPGRASLVARIEGSDPTAPKLCLMGHTDVVPVQPDDWHHDPFGGELIDGWVWGRGAIDMLCVTASMAIAFADLARRKVALPGSVVFAAVADEEAGGTAGAGWLLDHHRTDVMADYVLTENGGLHSGPRDEPFVGINVGEKGVAWRTLRVKPARFSRFGSLPHSRRRRSASVSAGAPSGLTTSCRSCPCTTSSCHARRVCCPSSARAWSRAHCARASTGRC